MKNKSWIFQRLLIAGICLLSVAGWSQQIASSVPNLVHYSGTLTDGSGKPLSGIVGVTFSLYKDSEGGAPLWMETQNVQPDKSGRYSVMLGSTASQGLPSALFASAEARWLGVQVQGYEEQPRVLLLSVPYALKAGDAATIGGLPPSAFLLAPAPSTSREDAGNSANVGSSIAVGGSGTPDFVPLWTSNQLLGNSALFQLGSGNSAMLGINTTTPAAALDVNGGVISRGSLQLPSTGTANASQGFNSQPFNATASVFNSSTQTAVPQNFQWQAEPTGNNTGNAGATLNLLFAQGSGNPAETGLNVASNGKITFAPGQTFPGTGTITGVTAGTDLIGGGANGNVTLSVDTTQVVTGVLAGTDLTGGGTGGVQTLNLDTTKVPQLSANNSFAGAVGVGAPANSNGWTPLALGSANSFGTWMTLANTSTGGHTWNILSAGGGNAEGAGNLGITDFTNKSTIYLEGNVNATSLTTTGPINASALTTTGSVSGATLTATGSVTGSTLSSSGGLYLGGGLFANGSTSLANAFVGYSGTSMTTGDHNTANGANALISNTSGDDNTADGSTVLYSNTTGSGNTGVGFEALVNIQGGSDNTALGIGAGPPSLFNGNLSNTTAIGAFAGVSASNSLVLGSIKGVNNAPADTNVGIGTTAPSQRLEVDSGNVLVTGANNFQNDGDTASLFLGDTNNFIQVTHGTGLTLGTFDAPAAVRINQYSGFVGIGTQSPDTTLSVNGNADKPGGGSWATFSDARLKNLHGSFTAGLSQIMQLHPIRYRYKDDNALGIRDRDEHVGFVAQEVKRVIPEAVTENSKGYLLVNNDPILWTMLNAIQEQQREIRRLRAQLHNQSLPTRQAVTKKADAGELRILHAELSRLREKDSRLEDRLTRLERNLENLNSRTTTVALAERQK